MMSLGLLAFLAVVIGLHALLLGICIRDLLAARRAARQTDETLCEAEAIVAGWAREEERHREPS